MSPEQAATRAALNVFLAQDLPNTQYPVLESARRDAAETMAHGAALWLGTLGYLIIVEIVGQNVAREGTSLPRNGSQACFVAGAQEFAARSIAERDARALYGLRCALAHQYGLRSDRGPVRYLYALRQSGPLIEHPAADWVKVQDPQDASRTVWPTAGPKNQTSINVIEVAVFVEELIANVRTENAQGRVALAPGVTAWDLRNRSQYLIT